MQKLSKTAGGRIALSMIGEGGEEVVESVLQPFLQRATYDPEARFDPREAAHGFAVGAVLGGLGGVPEAVGNIKTGTARDQAETGLRGPETARADVDASGVENAVQRIQTVSGGGLEAAQPQVQARQELAQADVLEQEVQRLYGKNKAAPQSEAAGKPRIRMEDFVNPESSVWNNVAYNDTAAQDSITQTVHQEMLGAGQVVQIPETTTQRTAEAYPDLRTMKKTDRIPIMKQKMNELKASLRQFLDGLKGTGFEFEVNGSILEARLYNAGIQEVLSKITQDKASMLLHSDEIFRNARYLYSTDSYDGNPNIYRWNYFYTPVQIGDQTLGVRIAVRDMKQTAHKEAESQIYNWGIKKDVLLGGGGPGVTPLSSGASSSTSSGGTVSSISDLTITGDSDFVKSGTAGQAGPQEDPLLTAIFGGKKRVDQSTLSQEQFEHLAELSGRGEVGMDASGRVYQVDPEEHIDRRDIDTVGSRKLNAFQFDHPELHGYFAEAAQQLGLELSHYVPGGETASRVSEDGQPYSYRIARTATPRIAQLIDTYRIPPRELSSALEAIINDRGQENYAAAKRLELMLDLMLSDGYTDPITGAVHGPNEAYLAEKRRIAGSDSYDGTGLGAADAGSVNTDYDRLQAQSDSFHPEGPNAARPVDVPTTDFDGRPISQTASTVMGAMAIPDDVIPMIEQMTADGKLSYDPVTNAASEARARKKIEQNGFDGAVEEYHSAVLSGRTSPEIEILGQTLLNNAANARDGKAVAELLSLYQAGGTNLGQAMQARQIMRKLSPEGQLYAIQRSVYNIDGEKIQVSPELIQKFLDQTDQAGRDAVMEEICRNVAGQLPGSWGKIFDSIRYLAMLGNTRTHIRNIIGNAVFQPFTWGKNRLGGIAEAVAQRAGVDVERTKTWHGANPLDHLSRQARAEYKDLADLLNGGTHYNEDRTGTKAIREYYNPFKNVKRFQKLADALDWSLGRLSRGNMGLLEKEVSPPAEVCYNGSDQIQSNQRRRRPC